MSESRNHEPDDIPDDLIAGVTSEEYEFPDVRRRAYGALLVLLASGAALAASFVVDESYINAGWITAASLGVGLGFYMLACSWRLRISEKEAILRAAASLSFPMGPASVSIGWRGGFSRPVWRVLAYSPEEPRPLRRGYVALDAVSGAVIDKIDEKNPEETWEVPPEASD